jgi:hypothetical protein
MIKIGNYWIKKYVKLEVLKPPQEMYRIIFRRASVYSMKVTIYVDKLHLIFKKGKNKVIIPLDKSKYVFKVKRDTTDHERPLGTLSIMGHLYATR